MTAKGYQVVCADPPWQFSDRLPGKKRGAERNYSVMSESDIRALGRWPKDWREHEKYRAQNCPPTHLAMCGKRFKLADDALLFLWRVASMPQEALDVVGAWGFEPKSEIVWVKLTREYDKRTVRPPGALPAATLHFGMGRYTRASHETCIIAARGRATQLVQSHSERSVFFAPVPRDKKGKIIHSAKPPEFYSIVERLIGEDAKKLELFARAARPGWTTAGDEIGVVKTSRYDGVGETFAEMAGMSNR